MISFALFSAMMMTAASFVFIECGWLVPFEKETEEEAAVAAGGRGRRNLLLSFHNTKDEMKKIQLMKRKTSKSGRERAHKGKKHKDSMEISSGT